MKSTLHPEEAGNQDQVLAVAALFKDAFSIDWLLELMVEKRPTQILSALEAGLKQEWLSKKGAGVYAFCDKKARKKWADSLPEDGKRLLHNHISDILMRELPDDENKAYTLAHHLMHIPNDTERCRYLVKAGDLHLRCFQTEDAFQCYNKVLEDLSGLNGEEADRLYSETAIKYSKISTARHDTAKVLSVLRSALGRARRLDVPRFEALLKMHTAKNEWLRSRYTSALKQFEAGWSLAEQLNDPKLMRTANTFSTFFLFWQGRFKEAVRIYEKSVPDIEKYPSGGFPLLAVMTVGYCYGQIGQVTQGLGMLDAIRSQCLERGDLYLASYTEGNIGNILLDIGRTEEALQFLEKSAKKAKEAHNDWVWLTGKIFLSYLYYLKGDQKKSVRYLGEFLSQSRKVQTTVYLYPYLMELGLAMKKGLFPEVDGLSLEREVQRMIRGKNIFMKGVAYRYEAILQQMAGGPPEKSVRALKNSIRWLEASGHQIEWIKSGVELARQHLATGDEEKAKALASTACKMAASLNETLVPDDLRGLIKDRPVGENLLKEILNLGQQVVTIRENKDLVQHIISTVNRLTGAERGAIFLLEERSTPQELVLRASKNLTSDQISDDDFAPSMRMIESVARAGTGRILDFSPEDGQKSDSDKIVRSQICVPMILRDRTVGVLYHDNRLLSSAFKESDLELLSYFAALAAFALDNAAAYEEIHRLNRKLSEETLYYKEEHLQNLHFEDIVGESPAIKAVLSQVDQVTKTDASVMIVGETGVGKELVARAIHRHSPRKDEPFIRVHCSALPESLIPSELFGHEKGAFTGAVRRRIGRFELADGGTLFLDEIGDISPDIQVKLLRVLQSQEFERVGGTDTLRSDFRLVVATNRNLEKDMKSQKFRPDLYYRLAVFPIHVPPLRERKEDIPLLAYYFLKIYSKKRGKRFSKIPRSDMERLMDYDWPGNVRELENIIERGTILSPDRVFRVPELETGYPEKVPHEADVTLKANERKHILWALDQTGWKVRGPGGTAELLEIPPSTLAFRMKKLGIQRPKKRNPPGQPMPQA
ncbi:MAG: sigma 54-interacting transcriptional regulator [Deltaproteobacteria bacterium]|nr:sigma 54-interacting transcriptional regulator [Deltaproteobacteria bacterium]